MLGNIELAGGGCLVLVGFRVRPEVAPPYALVVGVRQLLSRCLIGTGWQAEKSQGCSRYRRQRTLTAVRVVDVLNCQWNQPLRSLTPKRFGVPAKFLPDVVLTGHNVRDERPFRAQPPTQVTEDAVLGVHGRGTGKIIHTLATSNLVDRAGEHLIGAEDVDTQVPDPHLSKIGSRLK